MDPIKRSTRRPSARAVLVAGFLAFTLPATAQQSAPEPCGPLDNAFGPFDYRTERGQNLHLVESAHFPPIVESLLKGNRGYLGADIDYTLRAFPNHHRALLSAMRYGEKLKSPQPPHMSHSIECYFIRALRFRPDDATARMLYARYLDSVRRHDEAVAQLDITAREAKDNGFTHYNIALLHLEAQRYDQALRQAHVAIGLGFERPDLKDKLTALGRWKDPAPAQAAASAASR